MLGDLPSSCSSLLINEYVKNMPKKALTQRATSLTRHRIDQITPNNMNPILLSRTSGKNNYSELLQNASNTLRTLGVTS